MSHRCFIAGPLVLVSCLFAPVNVAPADPIVDTPDPGRGVLARDHLGRARLTLVADLQLLFIAAAGQAGEYPEIGALDPVDLDLPSARVGLLGASGAWRYLVRVDASEGLRLDTSDAQDQPLATVDRFIDDAYLVWRPRVWASLQLGRFKVPHSRFRQLERTRLTAFAVPAVVDRLAPDRRWGVAFHGDLGSLAYAAGAFADTDSLEPRRPDDPASDPALPTDPSASGRALATGYLWWTPRGPASPDPMATPSTDPWYGTLRPAAGLGVSWRERQGSDRLDLSLAVQLAYRRYAALTEVLAYSDDGTLGLGAALEVSVLVTDRAVVYALGEYDTQLSLWSAGAGAAVFVTCDRLNKVGVVGLVRRHTGVGPERDAVLVQLQSAL